MSRLLHGDEVERCIKQWVAPDVVSMKPYHVPAANGLIKLDAMENPYELPDSLREEWLSCLDSVQVNRYPDPSCTELSKAIRSCFSVPQQFGLMFGNGSDELIQIIAMLLGGKNRTFVAPVPTFSMYQQICTATATQFVGVPLNPDFSIDAEKLYQAIQQYDPACIFIAYPNNPTGNCFESSIIRRVLELTRGLVVVDEAYFAFCKKTVLSEISNYPNLIVLRTMSKSGLAGLRLGMAMGNSQWIAQLEKLRLPYNINSLTQAGARFYLQHHDVLEQQASKICDGRAWMYQQLCNTPGMEVFPSEANFLLFRVSRDPDAVFKKLRTKGVLVKNLHQQSSPLENCLRVTAGTTRENRFFIEALQSL